MANSESPVGPAINRQARKNAIDQGRQTPEYRKASVRQYRDPKGYRSHREALNTLAKWYFLGYRPGMAEHLLSDVTIFYALLCAWEFARHEAPSYWLSRELAEAFLHSDLPDGASNLKRVIPSGILMLPPRLLRSPEGFIDYFVFYHHDHIERDNTQIARENYYHSTPDKFDSIYWATESPESSRHAIYAGKIYLDSVVASPIQAGANMFEFAEEGADEIQEAQFIEKCQRLLIQALLVAQVRPELLEVEQGLGFGSKKAPGRRKEDLRPVLLSPNWIGKSYQRKRSVPITTDVTSGISKRPHWRRGHWRNQACGAGYQEHRLIWVEPLFISG